MFLILSLWIGLAFGAEPEENICDRILARSELVALIHREAAEDVPVHISDDPAGTYLSTELLNLISLPGGGVIFAMRNEYRYNEDGPASTRTTNDPFILVAPGRLPAVIRDEDRSTLAERDQAIATAVLAARDAVARDYVAHHVFEFGPNARLVALYDHKRLDDRPVVPYLVRVEDGRVTALTEGATRAPALRKTRMSASVLKGFRATNPRLEIVDYRATLVDWLRLVARIKAVDADGAAHVFCFEVEMDARGGRSVSALDPGDARLAPVP